MKPYPALFSPASQMWPERETTPVKRRINRPYGIRALDEMQMHAVVQGYREGKSGPQLASEFSVSVGVIYRVLAYKEMPLRSSGS